MKLPWRSRSGRGPKKGAHSPPAPWLAGPSIYHQIRGNTDPVSGRLADLGWVLPDEERRYADTEARWVPGAMDGVLVFHSEQGVEPRLAHRVASYVITIARRDAWRSKLALYELLAKERVISFIDAALEEVLRSGASPLPYLHEYSVQVAKNASDREPVKFAIALLGLFGQDGDDEIVSLLGLYDEFTLYSAVALSNLLAEPEDALWDLAQKVDGWGKIHLVQRLSSTSRADIKAWLLRDGFRNDIMYEYLAYACATGGDLSTALSADAIDDELLDSAGEIINALICGGPALDIADYDDAAYVVVRYLEHLEPRAHKVDHFVVADTVRRYLAQDADTKQPAGQTKWSDQQLAYAIELANRICLHRRWPAIVQDGLTSADAHLFQLSDRAATSLHIDTWEIHWSRLQDDPGDPGRWYRAMQTAHPDSIHLVVDLAAASLPLDKVATGAANSPGIGPRYRVHACLEMVVAGLGAYPGQGWSLIAACLKSPVTRARCQAVRALAEWGRENRTRDIEHALAEARKVEPDQTVRNLIDQTLAGERPADLPAQ